MRTCAIRRDQAALEFRRTRAVHEHAPRGRAALAGRAHRAEHDRRNREIEIGGLVDDDARCCRPSSSRPCRAVRRPARPTWRPTCVDPVNDTSGDALVVDEPRAASSVPGVDEQLEYGRQASAARGRGCRCAARRARTARSWRRASRPPHCPRWPRGTRSRTTRRPGS